MLKKIMKAWNAHGAATCTALSVGCAVVEGIWAYRAGKRAGQHPEWTTEQKVMNVIGPAATGAGAIVFAICAQKTNMANLATLAAENVMNEKKRQKLMKKAEEIVGEENINKIKQSMHPEPKKEELEKIDKINEEKLKDVPESSEERLAKEMYIFIDDVTGAKTVCTVEDMYANITEFQRRLHCDAAVSLGDWLKLAGFQRFKKGELPITQDVEEVDLTDKSDEDIGWSIEYVWECLECDWMDIYLVRCEAENGSTYYIVDFTLPPTCSAYYLD